MVISVKGQSISEAYRLKDEGRLIDAAEIVFILSQKAKIEANKHEALCLYGEIHELLAFYDENLKEEYFTITAYDTYQQVIQETESNSLYHLVAQNRLQTFYDNLITQGIFHLETDGQKSLQLFKKAFLINNQDPTLCRYAAKASEKTQNYPEGLYFMQRVYQLGSKTIETYESLAHYYDLLEQTDSALQLIDEGLQAYPGNINITLKGLSICLKKQRFPKAIEILEKRMTSHPNDESALITFGMIKEEMGLNYEAERYYLKALSLNQNSFQAYFQLGHLNFQQGIYYLNEFENWNPSKRRESNIRRSDLRKKVKSYLEAAIYNLEKAQSIEKNNEATLIMLKAAYFISGKQREVKKVDEKMSINN